MTDTTTPPSQLPAHIHYGETEEGTSVYVSTANIESPGVGSVRGYYTADDLRAIATDMDRRAVRVTGGAQSTTEKHIGEFQDDARYLLIERVRGRTGKDYSNRIDGGGCDSGDWRDFTLSEIRNAFNALDYHDEVSQPAPPPSSEPSEMLVDIHGLPTLIVRGPGGWRVKMVPQAPPADAGEALRMAELARTLQHIADTSDDHDSRASARAALATPTAGDAT